ncbi:MAG: T9SS type A sorting domain-containing protein [Bacteroidales bacterium]|nr:T9SS type A sorting domain-containing protein [Bacteroidales bacterium]
MKKYLLLVITIFVSLFSFSQVFVTINADEGNRLISPYLYAKNSAINNIENAKSDLQLAQEAGINMTRQNNGNNATNYNWRKKITCHPDWYNNVYACDWDAVAQNLNSFSPTIQGMFAFQLCGRVASTNAYNFKDWEYNGSQWWEGCSKNLCGGGTVTKNSDGTFSFTNGDISLYTEEWPMDSSVAILTHWEKDLNLDLNQFKYWNMDNEFEIWGSTHDDMFPVVNDEVYEMMMQNYFATVKIARKLFPNIKITGPVAASEWTWFCPSGGKPTYKGVTYTWLEYFILRCAEEEKACGVKMIDVIDLHNYPDDDDVADILQTHRMYWDKDYKYPKANGVKQVNAPIGNGWDNSITTECIFVRCQEWIDKYFGKGYDVSYGISEYNTKDVASNNAMITALAYASSLGEGARNGMEYFIPWGWKYGMWETVHLFSRYAKSINVSAVSSNEDMVSAYTSKNENNDSLTIIFVNRATSAMQVSTTIENFSVENNDYTTYQLANLPDSKETFLSHTNNALQTSTVSVNDNNMTMSLPAYSMTAVVLKNKTDKEDAPSAIEQVSESSCTISPNPCENEVTFVAGKRIKTIAVFNVTGACQSTYLVDALETTIDVSHLSSGVYVAKILYADNSSEIKQFVKN